MATSCVQLSETDFGFTHQAVGRTDGQHEGIRIKNKTSKSKSRAGTEGNKGMRNGRHSSSRSTQEADATKEPREKSQPEKEREPSTPNQPTEQRKPEQSRELSTPYQSREPSKPHQPKKPSKPRKSKKPKKFTCSSSECRGVCGCVLACITCRFCCFYCCFFCCGKYCNDDDNNDREWLSTKHWFTCCSLNLVVGVGILRAPIPAAD